MAGGPYLQEVRSLCPSPSTLRTRSWRERQKRGRILLRVMVDEAALAIGLIDRGILDPLRADDRVALTAATEKALEWKYDGARTNRYRNRRIGSGTRARRHADCDPGYFHNEDAPPIEALARRRGQTPAR